MSFYAMRIFSWNQLMLVFLHSFNVDLAFSRPDHSVQRKNMQDGVGKIWRSKTFTKTIHNLTRITLRQHIVWITHWYIVWQFFCIFWTNTLSNDNTSTYEKEIQDLRPIIKDLVFELLIKKVQNLLLQKNLH